MMNNIDLDTLMFRLRTDIHLLEKHKDSNQDRDLLNKRIERHKTDIINFLINNTNYGRKDLNETI